MTSLDEASALVWPDAQQPQSCGAPTTTRSINSSALNDLAHSVSSAARGLMDAVGQRWEERSKRARPQHQHSSPASIQEPWVDALLLPEQGFTQALQRSDFTVENGIFPRDHLFRVLLEQGLIQDALVLFKDPPPAAAAEGDAAGSEAAASQRLLACRVVSVTLMGHGVCGHPGIMHGGMTAALIDETCGYLLYLIRHKGLLDFAAVVTASLEVQYKQPLVPDHPVAVTAWVRETAGRKIWVEVVVSDAAYTPPPPTPPQASAPEAAVKVGAAGNGGAATGGGSSGSLSEAGGGCGRVYATGKALFIIPRPQGSSAALLEQHGAGVEAMALGQGLLPQRDGGERGLKPRPRYEGNPADV